MPTPGVTCSKCLGRIDAPMHELKRQLDERVRLIENRNATPETQRRKLGPPKLCSDCFFAALNSLADANESDEAETAT